MQNFIKINDNDNVVVALNVIPAGETIQVEIQGETKSVTALEEIPASQIPEAAAQWTTRWQSVTFLKAAKSSSMATA